METWASLWQTVQIRQKGLFSSVNCEPGWSWDMVAFADYDLWLVMGGHGSIQINGEGFPLHAGVSFCFPPGPIRLRADHDPSRPLQVFFCHFEVESTEPSPRLPRETRPVEIAVDGHLQSLIREFVLTGEGPWGRATREAMLWQLLLRREQPRPAVIDPLRDQIQQLVVEIEANAALPWSTEELARRLGLSPSHLRRKFREVLGRSPTQVVLEARMRRACLYLRESRQSISEIAENVGFSDIFYFSRRFKEHLGCAPSDWRKRPR